MAVQLIYHKLVEAFLHTQHYRPSKSSNFLTLTMTKNCRHMVGHPTSFQNNTHYPSVQPWRRMLSRWREERFLGDQACCPTGITGLTRPRESCVEWQAWLEIRNYDNIVFTSLTSAQAHHKTSPSSAR